MKRILKLLSVSGLLACIILFSGCGTGDDNLKGDDGRQDNYCRVVKGPVTGATVFYASGAPSETTKADGTYSCNQTPGVTTGAGYYKDMNGQIRLAPNMSTPASYGNVTPLTTLYNNASQATKTELARLLSSPRFDSVVVGQVTDQNLPIAKLNEGIGEALTQLQEQLGHGPSAEYLASFAAQIAAIVPALNAAPSSAAIAAAIPAHGEIRAATMNDIKNDVIAIANKVTTGSNLGPALPAGAVDPPVVDPVDVWTANNAQNPYNATYVKAKFAVHPISTYLYNVANFAAGDKLIFDDGTAVFVANTSGTDGLIDIIGTLNGQDATVRLTGIAPALDGAISNAGSFNTAFGPGSLAWASGAFTSVDVAGDNDRPADASMGAVTFNVHPTSTFTYDVAYFAAGDKLIFDDGTAIGVTNSNGADGIIDIIGTMNGKAVTIHLTGVAPAADGAVYGTESFNTTFGAGSLAWASGNPASSLVVEVSAANAQPYDASVGAVRYNVHPTSTYTYTVANFAAGDRMVFDSGTAIGLTNNNSTDGIIDIIGTMSGKAATMRLTGLAPATDGAIYGVNSFNAEFGPGSLVSQ